METREDAWQWLPRGCQRTPLRSIDVVANAASNAKPVRAQAQLSFHHDQACHTDTSSVAQRACPTSMLTLNSS